MNIMGDIAIFMQISKTQESRIYIRDYFIADIISYLSTSCPKSDITETVYYYLFHLIIVYPVSWLQFS